MNRPGLVMVALGALAVVAAGCGSDNAGGNDGGGGSAGVAGTGGGAGRGGASGGGAGTGGIAGTGGGAGLGGAAGSGGAAGTGGVAGGGGIAGGGGAAGGAGRGGASGGGGAAGAGGSAGRGGSGGAAGGSAGQGGSGGGAGGAAGTGGVPGGITYCGSIAVGGAGDRATITKRDTTRNLCFRFFFDDISPTTTPGLTLPPGWGSARAVAYADAACTGTGVPATSVTGTMAYSTPDAGAFVGPVDVDLVLTFPATGSIPASEPMRVDNLSLAGPCQ